MPKPNFIELDSSDATARFAILHEDRSVIAIDKPAGWLLVPFSWQRTNRNLQAAIVSSIAAGDFWARSRNLKFLRFVHRLDAETSGVLLFARSQGALHTYSGLFETRRMEKTYLAVVHGTPKQTAWTSRLKLGPDVNQIGRVKVDPRDGKEAETHFRVLQTLSGTPQGSVSLIEARPITGRTHQIRVHLAESGHAVVGDELYGKANRSTGKAPARSAFPLALRAMSLAYSDPFTRRRVHIQAAAAEFLATFGFAPAAKA